MNINNRIRELESKTFDIYNMDFGQARIQLPPLEEKFIYGVIDSIDPNAESLTQEQHDMITTTKVIMQFRIYDLSLGVLGSILNVEGDEDVSTFIKISLLQFYHKLAEDVVKLQKGIPDESEESEEDEELEDQEPKRPVIKFMPPYLSLPLIDKDSPTVNK